MEAQEQVQKTWRTKRNEDEIPSLAKLHLIPSYQ